LKLAAEVGKAKDLIYEWSTTGNGTIESPNSQVSEYVPSEDDVTVTFHLSISNECHTTNLETTIDMISVNSTFTINTESGSLLTFVDYEFLPEFLNADSYSWDFGDGTTSKEVSPTHQYQSEGEYTIVLTVEIGDCTTTYSLNVVVIPNTNLFVPNIFNPLSSNNENNRVKVYAEGVQSNDFSFQIFNRWGLVVYSTSNFIEANTIGWDGYSKGELQENGVYTYTLRGIRSDGEPFEQTGTITLSK